MEHERSQKKGRAESRALLSGLDDAVIRRLVDRMPDPVFIKDREHRWVYLNDACCEFIGYPKHELIGKSDYAFFPKEQADVFWEHDNVVFETGELDENVESFTDANGVLHTISTRKSLVRLDDGTPLLVGVIRDVTLVQERQRDWEKELYVAKEHLNSVIDNAPVIIATLDPNGTITMLRGRMIEGLHADLALGGNVFSLVKNFPKLTSAVERALAGERVNVVHEAGGYAYEIQFAPALNADGDRTGGIAVAHDITERQQLQRRLSQTDKMESMGKLARGVAHDFNNLLTIIQSALDMAQISAKGQISAYGERNLRTIRDAVERAARLTRQLLSFAKEHVIRLESVDLNSVIADMEDLLKRVTGNQIDLELQLEASEPQVFVDCGQIEQVLMNLCINASEAMPEGGKLRIRTRRVSGKEAGLGEEVGEFVEIQVQDDGVGMNEETLKHAFEPLFTTRVDGTGIGLSTCQTIITELCGKIEAESKRGVGTTFRIWLPILSGEQDGLAPPKAEVRVAQARTTVLLVEDDATLRTSVATCLEEIGFRVISAPNGEAAKAVIESGGRVDIVVTDVVMPHMSGPQFVSWLNGRVPSIFVTGYASDVLIRHGLSDPHTDFLHKPYTLSQLHRKIAEVLARPGYTGAAADAP